MRARHKGRKNAYPLGPLFLPTNSDAGASDAGAAEDTEETEDMKDTEGVEDTEESELSSHPNFNTYRKGF